MRWYRDTSHYSPEVGDLILDRILGAPALDASPLPDVRLDRATIDDDLVQDPGWRRSGTALANPDEVADLDEMLAYLRRVAKR